MSIDYYGVTTADPARIVELAGGETVPDGIAPIDVRRICTLIEMTTKLRDAHGELMFSGADGGYIQVHVAPTCVTIHTGVGDDDEVTSEMLELLQTLLDAGLNVWDPQQRTWFPGSAEQAAPAPAPKPAYTGPTRRPKR